MTDRSKWRIADAQVHVWAAPTPERPWLSDGKIPPQSEVPFGVDDLSAEMQRTGVQQAVLVPPMWEGPRNDLAIAAAQREPHRFSVMGRLDPSKAESVAALGTWLRTPGMLGVRLAFNRGDKGAQLQRAIDAGFFGAAQAHGVPIMMYVPGLVEETGALASRYPGLRLVIDHLALEETDRGKDLRKHTAPVRALACHANVAVKVSALPTYVQNPPGFEELRPLVYDMVASFGAARVFWGSDLSRLPCSYEDLVSFFVEDLRELDAAERYLILGEGIRRWLAWNNTGLEGAT